MRDIFGLAVAIVIAGLAQIVAPWSLPWWVGMIAAGLIAAATGVHILWNRLPEPVQTLIRPAFLAPTGKVRGWIGIAVLCFVLGSGYIVISRVTARSPEIPLPQPRPSAAPQSTAELPTILISRGDKLTFACDVPPPDEKEAPKVHQKIEEAKRNLEIFGDAIGATYTVTYIRGGIRLEIEITSEDMKRKILIATGLSDVTKLIYEARRVAQQEIISITANFPEPLRQFYSLQTPDPTSKASITVQTQIERLFSVPTGGCHMM